MRTVKPRAVLVPLVLLGLGLSLAAPGYAQAPLAAGGCGAGFVPTMHTCTPNRCSPSYIRLDTGVVAWMTFSVMGNNATCFGKSPGMLPFTETVHSPSGKFALSFVVPCCFKIMATGLSPSCDFRFKTGGGATVAQCIIDSSDGLPVELMEFSIESEEAASAEAPESSEAR